MITTARTIIKSALKDIEAIATGENPNADEFADGLTDLNEVVGVLRRIIIAVPVIVRPIFNLVATQEDYTMGSGGDFDVADTPNELEAANLILANTAPGVERPLEKCSFKRYDDISIKDLPSTMPMRFLYARGMNSALGTFTIWPVVNVGGYRVRVFYAQLLPYFTDLDTQYDMPDGYQAAYRGALSIKAAPSYGRTPSQLVKDNADAAVMAISVANAGQQPIECQLDTPGSSRRGSFNMLTGEFGR